MKQMSLHYLSPSKFVLTLAFMQIASLSALHAMDSPTEVFDHDHDRALRAILKKHNFNQDDFIEQDSVLPLYNVNKTFLERSIKDYQENIEDLQKSRVLTPTSRDYFYYPRSLLEMITNTMPSMPSISLWSSFSYFSNPIAQSSSPSSPEQPIANVLRTNDPADLTKLGNSISIPISAHPDYIETSPTSPLNNFFSEQPSYSVSSLNDSLKGSHEETAIFEYLALSIDGGGVRGLMPGMWVDYLEKKTNQPVSKIFELIGGTSIGGIGALLLTATDDGKTPKMRGSDLAKLIENRSGQIFPQRNSYNILARLWDEITSFTYNRYSAGPLKELLKEYVGDLTLEKSLTQVLVTAVDSEKDAPRVFDSSKPTDKICKLWEISLCTSAAPTFFPAHRLSTDQQLYIDGGITMNNPGIEVLKGLKEMPNFSLETTTILSLGTGNMPRVKIPTNAGKSSVGTIVSTIMAAQSESVEMTLTDLLNGKNQYFRANPRIERFISLDQLDPDSFRILQEGAESQYGVIDAFVASDPVRRRLERVAESQ